MMKLTSLVPFLLVLLWGPGVRAEVVRLGAELSEDAVTAIEDILADPEAFAGKRVRIEGEVTGVCTNRGCWMELTSPEDATLRVKVEDGVIVFPQSARGRHAVAEGEVEILELSREQYEAWMRHVAEEGGEPFDPGSLGDGPYRIVRLRGSGAEIRDSVPG